MPFLTMANFQTLFLVNLYKKTKPIYTMHSGVMSFSESTIANGIHRALIKPYLEASKTKASVSLSFDLNYHSSIVIYCRRNNEEDFTLLGETSQSPYVDSRPNLTVYSEVREYKAVFYNNGFPIGEPDFLEVKTKGRFRFF